MSAPEAAVLPEVRARVQAAEAELAAALGLLRAHGWPETAVDLARTQALVRTWTAPDGYLAALERGVAS